MLRTFILHNNNMNTEKSRGNMEYDLKWKPR